MRKAYVPFVALALAVGTVTATATPSQAVVTIRVSGQCAVRGQWETISAYWDWTSPNNQVVPLRSYVVGPARITQVAAYGNGGNNGGGIWRGSATSATATIGGASYTPRPGATITTYVWGNGTYCVLTLKAANAR